MRFSLSVIFLLLFYSFTNGQATDTKWYSEHEKNGIRIQNSFPKGGPYTGPTTEHFNYTYLVFYSRVVNETERPIDLSIGFSADSIAIPNSPNTFVKVFLPTDTMTLDKRNLFSYGITQLASFDESTTFQRTINPQEECLFYTVAIVYQTKDNADDEDRGGNRAEFLFEGQNIIFNMLPQIDAFNCGSIVFKE